ncbi:MAG: SUMF1/EgtB/PvdO family nonheme iron enzyme, partial [Pseudomonadota bacterium]
MRARTKDADFAPELVRVPGGEFLMGSAEREGLCDERPQHRVEIGYALLIGKYPVTFAEWDYYYEVAGRFEDGRDNPERAAVNAETAHPRYPCDEGWGRGRRPVINVSWYDAQDYLAWLSRETGRAYRLLSEAAWEYACRAGTQTAYGFGDIASSTLAHVDCSVPEEENDAFDRKTCEVGRYPANLFGLHDMHGNV